MLVGSLGMPQLDADTVLLLPLLQLLVLLPLLLLILLLLLLLLLVLLLLLLLPPPTLEVLGTASLEDLLSFLLLTGTMSNPDSNLKLCCCACCCCPSRWPQWCSWHCAMCPN